MTHKVLDITTYKFTAKDRLFLDTNIWLYNYCESCSVSPSYRPEVDSYSQALQDIHEKKSRIHIDVLVVSEFINRYARLKWKQEALNMTFKEFRNSKHFKPIAAEIALMVKQIMKEANKIESRFNRVKIDDMLNVYGTGETDFNDQVIAWLCKREGLTLITNDSDFKGQEISILTANQRLLD